MSSLSSSSVDDTVSRHKLHVIETDLEPDDIIAFWGIYKNFPPVEELVVFVGESHEPQKKLTHAIDVFRALQTAFPNRARRVIVVAGLASNKEFPYIRANGVELDVLVAKDFVLEDYQGVYQRGPELAFMMKPPREAMLVRVYCRNTEVFCYGSFNWRTLKCGASDLIELTSRFKRFNYVDSFSAIGSRNSAHILVNTHGEFRALVARAVLAWNQHIIRDCEEDLKTETDPEGRARSQKIIDNISKNIETQFVMADVCLSFLPKPVHRVALQKFESYPTWVDSDDSNVFVHTYSEEDKNFRRVALLQALGDAGFV